MEPYILKDGELEKLIAKIPGWEINSIYIEREFIFENFIDTFSFMTEC